MRHAFFVCLMFVLGATLAFGRAEAQQNQAPTVVTVVTSATANGTSDDFSGGTIALNAATTKSVYLNGVVEDLDGRDTISSVTGVFYRSGVSGGNACTADATNCYRVASCNLTNNADPNQKIYSCPMNLSYVSDSTDAGGRYPNENWVAYVKATDGSANGENSSVTKEIGSLLALTMPSSVAFGSRDVGSSSTVGNNVETSFTQAGNTQADVEVSMANQMNCTTGFIPRQNVKWSLTDVAYGDGSATSLSTTPTDTNLFVGYGTDAAPAPAKTLYWNLSVPSATGGSCSGTTVITAISH